MHIDDFRDEIKLKLTGDLLESELDDDTLNKIIKSALRELQRYINHTRLVTIPYKPCIDLSKKEDTNNVEIDVNSVVMVYRTDELSGAVSSTESTSDPMQVAQWQLLSGMGNLMYFQDAVYNYGAWNTLQQIKNTTSTDLAFRFDKDSNKLYINVSNGTPADITIEYIPIIHNVDEIKSPYWIDVLFRLSIALTKVTVGRVRTRYTQSNALWQGDGDTILQEGREELSNLRDMLLQNSELTYPID